MEKSSSYKIIITISALLFLTVFAVMFSTTNVAYADDFSLEFPDENYVQIKSVDDISANENYVALLDRTDKKVLFIGESVHSYSFDDLTISNVYIIGNKAIVQADEGYKQIDLTTFSAPEDAILPAGISYITTYGNNLFAHSVGTVSKYDENLSLVATYNDGCFNNMPIMVSDGEKIFLYSVEYGVSKYTVYNTGDGNSSKTNIEFNVVSASIGEFIFVNDGTTIKAVDVENGQVAFDTKIPSAVFFAFGNKIYVANGDDGFAVYTIDITNKTATLTSQFSMTGDGLDKLSYPTAVNYDGNKFVVADKGNNRVLFVGDTAYSINLNGVDNVAIGNSKIYASTTNTISIISNGEITSTFECSENIVDITYGNSLLVLGESKLFALIGGKLETLSSVENGKAIATSENGDLIYVLKNDKISTFNSNGEKVLFDVAVSGIDLAVDYAGNAYILQNDGTTLIVNMRQAVENIISAEEQNFDVVILENENLVATPNSISFFDGKLYFTTDENAVVSIQKGVSASTFIPSQNIEESTLKAGTVSSDTIAFADANKYDTGSTISAGTDILIFDQTSTLSGYIQGVYRGKTVYIFDNGITCDKQNNDINQVYKATENLRAYKYPDGKDFINVERSQLVTVIDDAFGIESGKWYRVKIDDKVYFVERSQLEEYSAPTPVGNDKKAVFGRAKANRAGGEVNVYQYTDETSTVLFKVTDGTKVEIIETVGDFYKVKYGDEFGYMEKDDVKLDGLTTVQIVAIVLAVVVLATGVIIFFITRKIKQDSEKED